MSDLGRCPSCSSRHKWDREANPTCPNCGVVYLPPVNRIPRRLPSLYCKDCPYGPAKSRRGLSNHERIHQI